MPDPFDNIVTDKPGYYLLDMGEVDRRAKLKKLTRAELRRRLDVSRNTPGNWARGTYASQSNVLAICLLLECKPCDIVVQPPAKPDTLDPASPKTILKHAALAELISPEFHRAAQDQGGYEVFDAGAFLSANLADLIDTHDLGPRSVKAVWEGLCELGMLARETLDGQYTFVLKTLDPYHWPSSFDTRLKNEKHLVASIVRNQWAALSQNDLLYKRRIAGVIRNQRDLLHRMGILTESLRESPGNATALEVMLLDCQFHQLWAAGDWMMGAIMQIAMQVQIQAFARLVFAVEHIHQRKTLTFVPPSPTEMVIHFHEDLVQIVDVFEEVSNTPGKRLGVLLRLIDSHANRGYNYVDEAWRLAQLVRESGSSDYAI